MPRFETGKRYKFTEVPNGSGVDKDKVFTLTTQSSWGRGTITMWHFKFEDEDEGASREFTVQTGGVDVERFVYGDYRVPWADFEYEEVVVDDAPQPSNVTTGLYPSSTRGPLRL